MKEVRLRFLTVAAALMLLGACSDNNPTEPAPPAVPAVATVAVSAITHTTAQCGGTITSDGGAAVTARGVCWCTSATPTTSEDTTADGTGSGDFASSLAGLAAGTTYYVRAYATNSAGTGYGDVLSFTTTEPLYMTVSSTFDFDSDSWTVSGGALTYRESGGNPGGYIEFEDNEDQCGFFMSHPRFHGDLSTYDQGTLSFDIINTGDNGGTMLGCFGLIRLSSGSLYAESNVVPYDSFFTEWTSFAIPMTAEAWGVEPAQWDSILTNVTDLIFYMDAQMAYADRTGLDNFRITSVDLNAGKKAPR